MHKKNQNKKRQNSKPSKHKNTQHMISTTSIVKRGFGVNSRRKFDENIHAYSTQSHKNGYCG